MFRLLQPLFILITASVLYGQAPKPTLYNNVSITNKYEQDVSQTYGDKYNIIDLKDPQNYQLPEKVAGEWPQWDKPGFVTALFIVTEYGKIAHPKILKESEPAAGKAALSALDTWEVTPPKLEGKNVSIITAQEFTFGREEFVQLFMPSVEMQKRVNDVNQLAQFIEEIQSASQEYFLGSNTNVSVVVALKPGNKSRYWVTSNTKEDTKKLEEKLNQLKAPDVSDLVLFSILSAATGSKFNPSQPVLPVEWEEAAATAAAQGNEPLQLDDVVKLVWPD